MGSALHVHVKAPFPDRRFLGTTPFYDNTFSVPADKPGADNSGCHFASRTDSRYQNLNSRNNPRKDQNLKQIEWLTPGQKKRENDQDCDKAKKHKGDNGANLSQEEGRQLRRRRPAGLTKRPCRIKSELIRQKLAEALLEFPPPSLSEVIRRVAVHPTKIRSDFPDLWRALRARYVQFKQDALSRKGQAFADDIRRTVAELHDKGINPTSQLGLPTLPKPLYRSWDIVAKAVRLARRELLIEPSAPSQTTPLIVYCLQWSDRSGHTSAPAAQ